MYLMNGSVKFNFHRNTGTFTGNSVDNNKSKRHKVY